MLPLPGLPKPSASERPVAPTLEPPRAAVTRLPVAAEKPDSIEPRDRTEHGRNVAASRRQAMWRSGAVWLGAMVASGVAGYGLGLGFNAVSGWLNAVGVIKDPGFANTLKKVFDPTLFAAVGMFTTGVASFFNDNVTGPLRPLTTRWVMSRSPDKVTLDPEVKSEIIHNWQVEQTVDARVLAGRWTITEMVTSWKPTFRQVAAEMRAGRLDDAAAFLGGDLIAAEALWFWVVPESDAIFALLRKPIAPYLREVSDADLERLKLATLAYVRDNRVEVADAARPGIDDATKAYFAPMLEQLLKRDARAHRA